MPWGLQRFQNTGQIHFVTFCCYHRRRLLTTDASRRVFETALERVRRSYRLYVYSYVIMPDHVHLLLSEPQPERGLEPHGGPLDPAFGLSGDVHWLNPQQHTLADALKSLKQGVSRRLLGNFPLKPKSGLIGPPEHFWQKRYFDLNIRNYAQFVEKLRYIHRNPVRAGLCERPEDWEWSSFRHHATGAEGRVEIESD
jgi:putative transposase